MFEKDAARWDESLKVGGMVPLFKKGDRQDWNYYRGVVLLAMVSRILARVLTPHKWVRCMKTTFDSGEWNQR